MKIFMKLWSLAPKKRKSPRQDGFPAVLFQKIWHIVGDDVTKAIRSFFCHGRISTESNTYLIVFISMVNNPTSIDQYRPISLSSTMHVWDYLKNTKSLQRVLLLVISLFQYAFVDSLLIIFLWHGSFHH